MEQFHQHKIRCAQLGPRCGVQQGHHAVISLEATSGRRGSGPALYMFIKKSIAQAASRRPRTGSAMIFAKPSIVQPAFERIEPLLRPRRALQSHRAGPHGGCTAHNPRQLCINSRSICVLPPWATNSTPMERVNKPMILVKIVSARGMPIGTTALAIEGNRDDVVTRRKRHRLVGGRTVSVGAHHFHPHTA